MPTSIGRDEVRALVDERDGTVAEVLPRPAYEWAHLPGAIHLPLKGWDLDQVRAVLDPERPVVVYCSDHQCDLSPRAASRLESLGYQAYDYVAGKADWLAHGLPYDGDALLAGRVVTTGIPTCSFRDRLADVRPALDASPTGALVALNAEGVVLGRLPREAVTDDGEVTVEELMHEGPTTVRPSEELGPLVERMHRGGVDAVLVTCSDGHLLGLLERERGHQAIHEPHEHAHR